MPGHANGQLFSQPFDFSGAHIRDRFAEFHVDRLGVEVMQGRVLERSIPQTTHPQEHPRGMHVADPQMESAPVETREWQRRHAESVERAGAKYRPVDGPVVEVLAMGVTPTNRAATILVALDLKGRVPNVGHPDRQMAPKNTPG